MGIACFPVAQSVRRTRRTLSHCDTPRSVGSTAGDWPSGMICISHLLAKVRIWLTVSLTYAAPLDPVLSGFEFKVRGCFGYGIPLKILRRRRWDAAVQARAGRGSGLSSRTRQCSGRA